MLDVVKVIATRVGDRAGAVLAQIRGVGHTGDDDAAEADDGVETFQAVGFAARPSITDTLEALVARVGDELWSLFMIDKGGALDLEEGETRVYGAKERDARLRMRATGDVDLNSKPGQSITVQGGTKGAARRDDATRSPVTITPGPSATTIAWTDRLGVPHALVINAGSAFDGSPVPTPTPSDIAGTVDEASVSVKIGD